MSRMRQLAERARAGEDVAVDELMDEAGDPELILAYEDLRDAAHELNEVFRYTSTGRPAPFLVELDAALARVDALTGEETAA